jgi:EpsI family protein
MIPRLFVLSACFIAATTYVTRAMEPERVTLREPLSGMPTEMAEWKGREAPKLTAEVLAVLGADEYLNRYYVVGGRDVVSLFVGYYQSQRQGDTIHSPMNCLPGAGWQPVETTRTDLQIAGRSSPITVNQVVIQKGLDRQVVLYWYQSHGRVVASEYWSKLFMVSDAIRFNRSDAAIVRVVSAVRSTETGDAEALGRAGRFVQVLFPSLEKFLPS